MAVGGYNVFRSYDEPGGIRDQLDAIAAKNPNTGPAELRAARRRRPLSGLDEPSVGSIRRAVPGERTLGA